MSTVTHEPVSTPAGATRRGLVGLVGAVSAGLVTAPAVAAPQRSGWDETTLQSDLDRYAGFGIKAAGGEGDRATGTWLEASLQTLGFETERQTYDTPFFEPAESLLEFGTARLDVVAQAPVRQTGDGGSAAPLLLWSQQDAISGIAVVSLPFRRWSSASQREIQEPVRAAFAAGAVAVLIVTTGPTGEALVLNAPPDAPPFAGPTAVVAPKDAAPLIEAARVGATGRLCITGRSGRREAFNVIGRLGEPTDPQLVVSTPRSGWLGSVGERGPGIAAWLGLARLAADGRWGSATWVSTSGHEYDNVGGQRFLANGAPHPDRTRLWAHLGANLAARDWHEVGTGLAPLPSADPQRFLAAPEAMLPDLARAFAGLPGLENPYSWDRGVQGELAEIKAGGYAHAFGVFGAHRFHHAVGDDLRCVAPGLVANAGQAFEWAIDQFLTGRSENRG
ncbi:hypothetical protein ABN401_04970 [Brevundimonas sp. C11]|uniref:PA domain-containing protein n=1 Tax=Brevundimonas aurifodinae TaxID=1508312 RepID=A0ABV1NL42_9CAUL